MAGKSVWGQLGAGITLVRNFVLNAVFVLVMLFVLLALLSTGSVGPSVPKDAALVLDPRGVLVDEKSPVDPLTRFLAPNLTGEVAMSDLTEALERATEDERIKLVVLDLDELSGASSGQASVLGDALKAFQHSGKEVIAYGTSFSQAQYLIASHADAVYLHPMGQLLLQGYGSNQLYFKELLDKLDVNIHIFRVGKYKEFVEPYTRSDMSEEARLANQNLVDELWQVYGDRVIENRDLDPARFADYTQSLHLQLATMGDLATAALEHHLVDELLTHDEARARIAAEVGYADDGEFTRIGFDAYLAATSGESEPGSAPAIGLITADGPILMGRQTQGVIAADTLISLIRRARQDEDIAALVLRINSPGGSAFASEMIRQELELLQISGKPVVVSMSNVAASGGYWISATADRILAQPTTITGSIGVFGIFPSFEETLSRFGVSSDGVSTTPLARSMDPLTGLGEEMTTILQLNVERTYEQFIDLVARGRNMTPAAVDEIAQGRVWTGTRAHALGLVDQLGSLEDAIITAAGLAEVDEYAVEPIRPSLSPRELFFSRLGDIENRALNRSILARFEPLKQLQSVKTLLQTLDDPTSSYALCEACVLSSGWW